jgi:hypothetical protein
MQYRLLRRVAELAVLLEVVAAALLAVPDCKRPPLPVRDVVLAAALMEIQMAPQPELVAAR